MKKKIQLPASVRKNLKNKTAATPEEKKQFSPVVNLDPLLDAKDKAIIKPESYKIGSMISSIQTRDLVLKHIGVKDVSGVLYGIKYLTDSRVPFGKMVIKDPKNITIDIITVAEDAPDGV